jgi:hypothetical protein
VRRTNFFTTRKAVTILSSVAIPTDIVKVIASEMSAGVERAVECWMVQIEQALTDVRLTSLGRLNAVNEILNTYKELTGKTALAGRQKLYLVKGRYEF